MLCRECGKLLPEKGDYCPFCGQRRQPLEPVEETPAPRKRWLKWLPWAGGGVAVALVAVLLTVLLWPRADWYIAKETVTVNGSDAPTTAWRTFRPDGQVAATDLGENTYDSRGRLVVKDREYELNEETGEYVSGEPEDGTVIYVYNRSGQLIRVEDYSLSQTEPDRITYTYHTNGAIRTCTVETPGTPQFCRTVYTYTRTGLPLSLETYGKQGQSAYEERINWVEYAYEKQQIVAITHYYPSGEVEKNTVITEQDDTHIRLTYLDGTYVDYTYNEDGLPIRIESSEDATVYTYEWAQR